MPVREVLPASRLAIELGIRAGSRNGRVQSAERDGQRMRVRLGGARSAADHARAAHAQIQRSLHPVLGLGSGVVEAAHAALAARQKYARSDAVLGARGTKL